jgi:histidinol-phosphate/aromatic aminotransferase/cobyric acid decarboxylase-like protein
LGHVSRVLILLLILILFLAAPIRASQLLIDLIDKSLVFIDFAGCLECLSVCAMKAQIRHLKQTKRLANTATNHSFVVSVATAVEREMIYGLRHDIYAQELGQYPANPQGRLSDPLDERNIYLVARLENQLAGFISLTPPPTEQRKPAVASWPGLLKNPLLAQHYSVDKYVSRDVFPFVFDEHLFEIRLLTVVKPHRGRELATLLMYAAFRWVEAHAGTRIIAIGRHEVVEMYLRSGLEQLGISVQSGAVTYDLLQVTTSALREHMRNFGGLLDRLESKTKWDLNFPFRKPASCFHGGAFFDDIGVDFHDLARQKKVINADVLDAWFPPSPKVISTLEEYLPWLLRTSPPTECTGLVETIARTRGVDPVNILPGAGSSDLIFRALRHWLNSSSHALILDPTYGEYAHVLERVIGCTADRLKLNRYDNYDVDLKRLEAALADNYDLVVLVNPNSPTGRYIQKKQLERLLRVAPARTRVWVDETYIEYANTHGRAGSAIESGQSESIERFAAASENIIVCKSMSKVYALSGARAAYLCGGAHQLEELRAITPPWVVSLPAQVAAVRALQDPVYYEAQYRETHQLREQLVKGLESLDLDTIPGIANFVLCHLDACGIDARTVVMRCRERGLFLRDAAAMGSGLGKHALRIAVKDNQTNDQMLEILEAAITGARVSTLQLRNWARET